jgi:hypothetical protein
LSQERVKSFTLLSILVLSGCGTVDQFGSRVYDANLNSQYAANQEALANIIRASRHRTMNFIAITQVTGGQTEALSTGLPTIHFGPNQPPADHIYAISNTLSSVVSGGYQSNPLESTQFQDGMLSPISLRTVAQLVASHLREPVFYSVVSEIIVTDAETNNTAILINSPTSNTNYSTQSISANANEFERCESYLFDDSSPLEWRGADRIFHSHDCSFSRFENFMSVLMQMGLSAELIAADTGGSKATAQGATSEAKGRLCFDQALLLQSSAKAGDFLVRNFLNGHSTELCGSTPKSTTRTAQTRSIKPTSSASGASVNNANSLTVRVGEKNVVLSFVFRSPIAVFDYYGEWYSSGYPFHGYRTDSARKLLNGEPFVNIVDGVAGCYVSVIYDGRSFCIPEQSEHTALLADILQQLRDLNIQPTDLNSAFTVRLSGT